MKNDVAVPYLNYTNSYWRSFFQYVVNSSGGPNSSNRSSSLRSSIVSDTGSIGNNPSVEGSVWSNEQEEEHSPKKRRRVSVRDEDIPVVNIVRTISSFQMYFV
jgi:hypothetical protein